MNNRKIAAVFTSAMNDLIVVGENELAETISEHFPWIVKSTLLELIEFVLKDPEKIFLEIEHQCKRYHFYYRARNERYFVVVVKKINTGNFFASIYETGKKPRNVHQRLERIW